MIDEKPALTKDLLRGVAFIALIVIGMLLWAIFGHPPYGFFSLLKLSVFCISVGGAYVAYLISPKLIPLSFFLCASALVHVTGKMKREDWARFNWIEIGLLATLLIACFGALRSKQ